MERVAARLAQSIVFGGYDGAGSLRGIIGLRAETAPKIKHIATIWGMYVTASARGTGLAQRLVQTAVADARRSARSLRLSVVTTNAPAIRLYASAGFKSWAVDKDALCVDGVFFDEALMRLDFD